MTGLELFFIFGTMFYLGKRAVKASFSKVKTERQETLAGYDFSDEFRKSERKIQANIKEPNDDNVMRILGPVKKVNNTLTNKKEYTNGKKK